MSNLQDHTLLANDYETICFSMNIGRVVCHANCITDQNNVMASEKNLTLEDICNLVSYFKFFLQNWEETFLINDSRLFVAKERGVIFYKFSEEYESALDFTPDVYRKSNSDPHDFLMSIKIDNSFCTIVLRLYKHDIQSVVSWFSLAIPLLSAENDTDIKNGFQHV